MVPSTALKNDALLPATFGTLMQSIQQLHCNTAVTEATLALVPPVVLASSNNSKGWTICMIRKCTMY